MKIITDINAPFQSETPIAAALGYFDGLHLGHQKIISQTKVAGYKRGVITFKNQPAVFITQSKKPSRLLSTEDKISMLEELGTEYLFLFEFTENVKNMSKDDFIKIFLKKFNVRYAVAGFNFNFGRNKEGDINYFKKACKAEGIIPKVIAPVKYRGNVISSTLIRQSLYKGEVSAAAKMLGRPFYLKGKVIRGKKLGRLIGFPTANIEVADDIIVPKWGVYETNVVFNGQNFKSITNVGNNPTIHGDHLRIETNILDFDKDIYGQEIKIEFIHHIRDEKKFDDIMQLMKQIQSDIKAIKRH